MFKWLQNTFSSPEAEEDRLRERAEQRKQVRRSANAVDYPANPPGDTDSSEIKVVNIEDVIGGVRERERSQLVAQMQKEFDYPVFEGEIKHGYTRQFVGRSDLCPQCQSPTERLHTHTLYATKQGTRAMFAPAHFCVACPTVVIDEEMIRDNVRGGFKYRAILGISPHGDEPQLFSTWNGKESIYVFDENGNPEGISAAGEIDVMEFARSKPQGKSKQEKNVQKAKRKQRKKNRKR
ncbi:MAG: hypothetical protein AAF639_37835 [Chloroflexota bacterium]